MRIVTSRYIGALFLGAALMLCEVGALAQVKSDSTLSKVGLGAVGSNIEPNLTFSLRRRGGSSNGTSGIGSGTSVDEILEWCRGSRAYLERQRTKARSYLRTTSDYVGAKNILIRSLNDALRIEKNVDHSETLSYLLISRALELAQNLDSLTLSDQSSASERATFTYEFTYRFFTFMFNALDDLESDYVQYHYSDCAKGNCHRREADDIEAKYVGYVRDELLWLVNTYTYESNFPWAGVRAPRAPVDAYLKALEFIVGYAFEDMNNSSYRLRFACQVLELQQMHADLVAFNSNSKDGFINDVYAVDETYQEIKKIAEAQGCFINDQKRRER